MKKIMVVIMIAVLAIAGALENSAWALEGVPSNIKDAQELMKWITQEFQYKMKVPDKPQTPQETISLKSGDCDDFATLAYAVLKRLGIPSEIVIIEFEGLSVQHALCLWQDEMGSYYVISNRRMYNTYKHTVSDAVSRLYPDWGKITYCNERRENIKVEYRGSHKVESQRAAIMSY